MAFDSRQHHFPLGQSTADRSTFMLQDVEERDAVLRQD
jgi:hypothetical protein